jgi:S-adenosyl-L-methionine hydrolase (adenosine-forming)
MKRITLLTDFGTRDGYVGAMKGVISSILPAAEMDDISHHVAPGDVEGAALALERYWSRYPEGTVHLCVVDPGVGTARKPLALEVEHRFVVAPDNGLVSRILPPPEDAEASWRAVILKNPAYLLEGGSRTFHGRDVFAPAAAHLARGIPLSELGPPEEDPVRLPASTPMEDEGLIRGKVIAVDRFGNLVTDLPGNRLPGVVRVLVGETSVPVGETYGDVDPGDPLALVNSDARVEVAVRDGSAARILEAGVGTPVTLRIVGGGQGDAGRTGG